MTLAHIDAENPRVRPGRARVAVAGLIPESIGGDHGQRVTKHGVDHLLGVVEQDNQAAFLAIAIKARFRQPLARGHPEQIAVILFRTVYPGVEARGVEPGLARGVRIHFCRDVQAVCAGLADHLQQVRRVAQ